MEHLTRTDQVGGDDLTSARLAALLGYWSGKRARGVLPRRGDLDPADLRDLLPNLMLLDVESAPPRFRFRLVGTRMVEVLGHDATGLPLEDGREGHDLLEPLRRVVATARPVASLGTLAWSNGGRVDIEWLFLPLGAGGAEVTMILAGADFFSPSLVWPEGEPLIELAGRPEAAALAVA